MRNYANESSAKLNRYIYDAPATSIGAAMSPEWVAAQLSELSAALVEPIWKKVKIEDTFEQVQGRATSEMRQCVLVADDRHGHELYYDPVANEFVLAYSGDPPTTFNVREMPLVASWLDRLNLLPADHLRRPLASIVE